MASIHNQVRTVAEALTYYFLDKHWEFFEEDEIRHLMKNLDLNRLSDKALVDNTFIRDQIQWNVVPRDKIIRCASRLLDNQEEDYVLTEMGLDELGLKVGEVMHLLRRKPNIVEAFHIDLDNTTIQEAFDVMLLGTEYFLENLNWKAKNFDYHQGFSIAKAYDFDFDVLKGLPYKRFNNLQISQVIAFGGIPYAELFDLSKLKPSDWIYILERRGEMYELMDPLLFFNNDVFDLVRLLELFDYPELHVMIKHRLQELTKYGVERLLISHFQYHDKVDLSILDENNIVKIQEIHPEFQM